MKIEKFDKISTASFHDFEWPGSLPAFSAINVVLGWNGSGKTVLSRILRSFERRSLIVLPAGSKFSITIDGAKVNQDSLDKFEGPIRVFNEDYVRVIMAQGALPYVVYVGEDPVDYSELETSVGKLEGELAKIVCEDRHTAIAKSTAEYIRTLDGIGNISKEKEPSGKYNAYNATSFEKRMLDFDAQAPGPEQKFDPSVFKIEEDELKRLRQQLANQDAKDKEYSIIKKWNDWTTEEHKNIGDLLNKKPGYEKSERIASHQSNADEYGWIRTGVGLHKLTDSKARYRTCLFCNSTISNAEELLKHFTNDVIQMNQKLASYLVTISEALRDLEGAKVFYASESEALGSIMKSLRMALTAKQANLAEPVSASEFQDALKGRDLEPKPLKDVAHKLEKHYVAAAYEDYRREKAAYDSNRLKSKELSDQIKAKRGELSGLRAKAKSVHIPAARLNELLKTTFPYKKIELCDTEEEIGYEISRNGDRCVLSSLSEGERNFIALAYFLLHINTQKEGEELANDGVVVIDDPVSSLDKNSIFQIFSILARETERCAGRQYFFLTHNLDFYAHLNTFFKDDGANYYQVVYGDGGSRMEEVHKMLRKFKSDYQYSVSVLWGKRDDCDLEDAYYVVNLMRRVWETLLYFKYGAGDYRGRLSQAYESALQSQISTMNGAPQDRIEQVKNKYYANREAMYLFTNFASHDFISTDTIDTSVLGGAKERIQDFFEVLKLIDKDHYASLTKMQ